VLYDETKVSQYAPFPVRSSLTIPPRDIELKVQENMASLKGLLYPLEMSLPSGNRSRMVRETQSHWEHPPAPISDSSHTLSRYEWRFSGAWVMSSRKYIKFILFLFIYVFLTKNDMKSNKKLEG